jgi:myo-inositol-1(or 4)-monophosphatase
MKKDDGHIDFEELVSDLPIDITVDPDGEFITKFYSKTQGIRAIGSTSLNLCYVAAGSADGSWEFDTYPWDIAAGVLIIRESGGSVSTPDGTEFKLDIDNRDELKPLLSTNGNILSSILDTL